MLLCLLLECCLEYLSSRISIPRCSINFHTAQLINNINKYLKRAISRFLRSLQPLIFCKTQCIKDSEVDIFFKIISCVVISTSICWKVAKFDSRLLFIIAFWRHCALCACYVGEILDDDISFWTYFEIRKNRLKHLKLSNLVGGRATSPALSSKLRPEDINNNNST